MVGRFRSAIQLEDLKEIAEMVLANVVAAIIVSAIEAQRTSLLSTCDEPRGAGSDPRPVPYEGYPKEVAMLQEIRRFAVMLVACVVGQLIARAIEGRRRG